MSFQIQTQKVTAYPDFYDNQKTGKRSYSVTIMQPVSVAVELSPIMGGNIKEMQTLLSESKENGLEVNLDYQTSLDNFGKQKFVVYGVTPVANNSLLNNKVK